MSLHNAIATLDIPEDDISSYEGSEVDELMMTKLLHLYGKSNLVKYRFTSTNGNIGTINEFMKMFNTESKLQSIAPSPCEPMKFLVLGWAEGSRTDLDLGKTRYTAISNNLFKDGIEHNLVTKDSIGVAYHGRMLTRVKVYVVQKQRVSKRYRDEVQHES